MFQVPDQTGRRFVVTGATSGIGQETARRLASAGASVILAVRSTEKGASAREAILAESPGAEVEVRRLDLADQTSVRGFADGMLEDGRRLDVLVNNAGVMSPRRRLETIDGFELQFATNFLGPFALTVRLLPLLLDRPGARVATMASGTARFGRIGFDDLQYERRRYSPTLSYAQSKLADLLMGRHLAVLATERGWDLLSAMGDPGYTRTRLQTAGANLTRSDQRPPIRRTLLPSQEVGPGADGLLVAATSPEAAQGGYYGPGGLLHLVGPAVPFAIPRSARDDTLAARLWQRAEELTGLTTPD